VKYAFLLQGSLFLALFACLIFMGSLCLVMLLLVWAYWKHRKLFSAKDHLRWWLVFIFYILLFTPLIAYTLFLKNTGALYYGSLDGMWKVTGKTLSQNVFFQDGIWLKWLLFGIIMIGIIRYLIRLKGINIFKFLQNQEHILAYFFFGNLCIIWLLAKLLHVNYPEDRTGMYLILLAILLFGFSLQDRKWSRWIALLLCYFPVSLIAHMSLTTCVFAPETRIGNDFYRIVKKQLASNNNIIVYPTMHLCWHYHERMQNQKNFPNASREFNPVFDFILTRDVMVLKRPDPTLFKLIAVDKESGHLAYKRIKPMHRKNWYQHTFKISKTRVERMDLKSFDISNLDSTKKIEVIVKGEVFIETPYESLIFGMGVCNDKNEELRYDYMEQRWSEGAKNSHFFVNIRYVFENFRPEEKKLQVYLLNRFKKQIRLVNGIIEVKLLEP